MNHKYKDLTQIKEKLRSIINLHASIIQFRITNDAHEATRTQHLTTTDPWYFGRVYLKGS